MLWILMNIELKNHDKIKFMNAKLFRTFKNDNAEVWKYSQWRYKEFKDINKGLIYFDNEGI